MTEPAPEVFISIDIETAGPSPRTHAMLSIGACLVDDQETSFYVELKPDSDTVVESALAVSGLDLATLAEHGTEPAVAMQQFADWVATVTPEGRPVFTAFNASFDWMFINDYFQRYLGSNPFGHSSLDIKAYAMGRRQSTWAQTSMRILSPLYLGGRHLMHNALEDARDQAELFRALRASHPDD